MQDADDTRSKETGKSLSDDFFVCLSGDLEKDIQQGTVFQKKMSENIRNCEDNMAMGNVKHAFSKCIGALHVIEVAAGWTETGLAGEGHPADLIATVTTIHGAILRIPAVEHFSDFGNDDRSKV